jgi:hypothetical protein
MRQQMTREVSDNDLLIEDIDLVLLRRIEETARFRGQSIEEEAVVLMERGLALEEAAD